MTTSAPVNPRPAPSPRCLRSGGFFTPDALIVKNKVLDKLKFILYYTDSSKGESPDGRGAKAPSETTSYGPAAVKGPRPSAPQRMTGGLIPELPFQLRRRAGTRDAADRERGAPEYERHGGMTT